MTTVVPPASPALAVASPAPSLDVAPGSVVRVRDEDWLVTQVSMTSDGTLVTVQGLSELVRDTTAQFFAGIDRIVPVDPRRTRVIADAAAEGLVARSAGRARTGAEAEVAATDAEPLPEWEAALLAGAEAEQTEQAVVEQVEQAAEPGEQTAGAAQQA